MLLGGRSAHLCKGTVYKNVVAGPHMRPKEESTLHTIRNLFTLLSSVGGDALRRYNTGPC